MNSVMNKGMLGDLVFDVLRRRPGLSRTTEFLDKLKNFGFRYATQGGVSVGMEDMVIPAEKADDPGRGAGRRGSLHPGVPQGRDLVR